MKDEKAVCANCNHRLKRSIKIKSSEKIGRKEGIAVIKQKEDIYPVVEMKCPECKNKKCFFWTQQTRAADESETKFFKCVKCNHTWRVYR